MIGLVIAALFSGFFFLDRYISNGLWQKDYFIFWALGFCFGISLALSGAIYFKGERK